MNQVQAIVDLMLGRGDSQYGGEAVTQREHALQAATLAEHSGAAPPLIVASLLHDIGHLLHTLPDDAPDTGIDDHHETSGHHFLRSQFPESVTEPVRLHVAAKRYLCAVDPAYLDGLSGPSRISLELQGGPMSDSEAAEFNQHPFARDAVQLRRWDDQAKVAGLETPPLEHFQGFIEATLCTGRSTS